MGKINWQRVFLGEVLWAVVHNVIGAASMYLFIGTAWVAAVQALGIPGNPFQETTSILTLLLVTLMVGFFAVWFYAAIRPRYGAGPKTAFGAGFALWVIGALLPSISFWNLLRLPAGLMLTTLAVVFVGVVAATLVAAWPYKEEF